MFSALRAILFQFELVGSIAFVFHTRIIPVLAFLASQGDYDSSFLGHFLIRP